MYTFKFYLPGKVLAEVRTFCATRDIDAWMIADQYAYKNGYVDFDKV